MQTVSSNVSTSNNTPVAAQMFAQSVDVFLPGPTENILQDSTNDPDALLRDINDTVMSAMLSEVNTSDLPSEAVVLQAINLSLFGTDFEEHLNAEHDQNM